MYKSLDKKGLIVMRINAIILACLLFIILAITAYFLIPIIKTKGQMIIFIFLIIFTFILAILNILLFPSIRYSRYKYLITKERIEVKKGLFYITTSVIQIKRVQKIELNNGPIDRYFDLSNVNIYTAAGVVEIKFLNNKEAQKICNKVNTLLKRELVSQK